MLSPAFTPFSSLRVHFCLFSISETIRRGRVWGLRKWPIEVRGQIGRVRSGSRGSASIQFQLMMPRGGGNRRGKEEDAVQYAVICIHPLHACASVQPSEPIRKWIYQSGKNGDNFAPDLASTRKLVDVQERNKLWGCYNPGGDDLRPDKRSFGRLHPVHLKMH